MTSLVALLVIAIVSLLIVRIGAMALTMTGLAGDAASFQAYSAFFGVGFTTSEAELVVNHPIRRRIVRDLILAGNIGLTTALATVIITFGRIDHARDVGIAISLIAVGGIALALVTKIGILKRLIDFLIRRTLERTGMVKALDYEFLLHIKAGYSVSEIEILPNSALAGKSLKESRPADCGVVVLCITRDDGTFIGVPGPNDILMPGDVAAVYGKDSDVANVARQTGCAGGRREDGPEGSPTDADAAATDSVEADERLKATAESGRAT